MTTIEQQIIAKGLTAPRVTPADIEHAIVATQFHIFPGSTTTVCCLTLRNGFTVTGESACASPENFDAEIGQKIALDNAKQKIWQLEGYLLRQRLSGAINIDGVARVCHEANRAYCQALLDDSQTSWEDAPEWQRVSARMGVDLHLSGDFGPEASHAAWMRNKFDEGWKYGPVKLIDRKEHPCMVPFDKLPREQQAKDYIFRAIVHALKGPAT